MSWLPKWMRPKAGGLDAAESWRGRRDLGWSRGTPMDEDNLIGDNDREKTRLKCSDLRRNNAVVAGVSERIALWVVGSGLMPQCKTDDPIWNRDAEQFWMEIFTPTCDSRGRASLVDLQRQTVSLRPTHGGMYFELQKDGKIRPIETERIRNPKDPAAAKAYTEGVKVDRTTGRIISFCVHSRDDHGSFGGQQTHTDIPAEAILRAITPPWRPDQVRETPDLAPVVNALRDIGEMNEYVLNTSKWQSQVLGVLAKQQGGLGMAGLPKTNTNPTPNQRQTYKTDWGMVYEVHPGEALDLKTSPTPGAQHIPYMKYQYAVCSSALGFPYEFLTLDLSGLDYSRQKGLLLLVNYACRPWKKWLVDSFLQPLWNWRIAMEMRPGGQLKPAPLKAGKFGTGVSQWNRVDWQSPEEVWIDRQEAQQADVLEIQAGLNTLSAAAKRRGLDLEDLLMQKSSDYLLIEKISKATGVPMDQLVKLQIPGQNGTIQKAAQPAPMEPTQTEGKKDEPGK